MMWVTLLLSDSHWWNPKTRNKREKDRPRGCRNLRYFKRKLHRQILHIVILQKTNLDSSNPGAGKLLLLVSQPCLPWRKGVPCPNLQIHDIHCFQWLTNWVSFLGWCSQLCKNGMGVEIKFSSKKSDLAFEPVRANEHFSVAPALLSWQPKPWVCSQSRGCFVASRPGCCPAPARPLCQAHCPWQHVASLSLGCCARVPWAQRAQIHPQQCNNIIKIIWHKEHYLA